MSLHPKLEDTLLVTDLCTNTVLLGPPWSLPTDRRTEETSALVRFSTSLNKSRRSTDDDLLLPLFFFFFFQKRKKSKATQRVCFMDVTGLAPAYQTFSTSAQFPLIGLWPLFFINVFMAFWSIVCFF